MSRFSLSLLSKCSSSIQWVKNEGKKQIFAPIGALVVLILFALFTLISFATLRVQLGIIKQQKESLDEWSFQARTTLAKQENQRPFEPRVSQVDPYYFEKVLEKHTCLSGEKEVLETIVNQPLLQNWEGLKKRIEFLNSGKNHLKFVERTRRKQGRVSEIESKILHPVQGDLTDLKWLLEAVEEPLPTSGAPSMQFRFFDLKRGKSFSAKEVYTIDLEIIKKEIEKHDQ